MESLDSVSFVSPVKKKQYQYILSTQSNSFKNLLFYLMWNFIFKKKNQKAVNSWHMVAAQSVC